MDILKQAEDSMRLCEKIRKETTRSCKRSSRCINEEQTTHVGGDGAKAMIDFVKILKKFD